MPGFKKKKLKLPDTLGEYLKRSRQNKGVSLALAERELKVRKDYLSLLEKEEFDKLPANVYTKGILKAYAAFLGLNYEKEVLPLYERERGIHTSVHGEKKPSKVDVTTQLKSPRFVLTPKTVIAFIVIVFVLGLGFYLWYQFSAFASAPELSLSQPEEGLNLTKSLVTVVGKTNPGIDLFINGQKIPLEEDGSFKNQVSLQEGVNIVEVVARNKVGKETVIRRNVMVELPVIVGKDKSDSKKTDGIAIVVTIRDGATWLSVEEDGRLIYEGTMLPGSSQMFEAKKSISISSGKGDNTLIEVNGEDWGVLEDTAGVVRDLVITKEMAERGR